MLRVLISSKWETAILANDLQRLNRRVSESFHKTTCHRDIKHWVPDGLKYGSTWKLGVFSPSPYHIHLVSSASQTTGFPFTNSILTKLSEVLSMHDSTQVDRRNLNRLPSMNRTIVGVASKESHWMRHVPTHILWIENIHYFHSYGAEYDRPQNVYRFIFKYFKKRNFPLHLLYKSSTMICLRRFLSFSLFNFDYFSL